MKPDSLHQHKLSSRLKRKSHLREAAVWLLGLAVLAFMEPTGEHLFSFCPFSWVWAEGCWGCGLGHAIAYMWRGEWRASWEAHPLALPAVLILLHRCWQLLAWQQEPQCENTGANKSMFKFRFCRRKWPV